MSTIESIYKSYGILADAKDEAGKHETQYMTLISSVSGGPAEKKLATQFIPKFFKYFPNLKSEAINAHLDLCDDEDLSIRRSAIKMLPEFCNGVSDMVLKISDMLSQLLDNTDKIELEIVSEALISLLKQHPEGVITGVIQQLNSGDPTLQDSIFTFFINNLPLIEKLSAENPSAAVSLKNGLLQFLLQPSNLTIQKIKSCTILINKISSHVTEWNEIVDVIVNYIKIEEFMIEDSSMVQSVLECFDMLIKYINKCFSCKKIVSFCVEKIFPALFVLQTIDEEQRNNLCLILRKLYELSHLMFDEDINTLFPVLFHLTMNYFPDPSYSDTMTKESKASSDLANKQKLNYDIAECFLVLLYSLSSKSKFFIDDITKFNNLKTRLMYLHRLVMDPKTDESSSAYSLQSKDDPSLTPEISTVTAPSAKKFKPITIDSLSVSSTPSNLRSIRPTPSISVGSRSLLSDSARSIVELVKIFHRSPPDFTIKYKPSWLRKQLQKIDISTKDTKKPIIQPFFKRSFADSAASISSNNNTKDAKVGRGRKNIRSIYVNPHRRGDQVNEMQPPVLSPSIPVRGRGGSQRRNLTRRGVARRKP